MDRQTATEAMYSNQIGRKADISRTATRAGIENNSAPTFWKKRCFYFITDSKYLDGKAILEFLLYGQTRYSKALTHEKCIRSSDSQPVHWFIHVLLDTLQLNLSPSLRYRLPRDGICTISWKNNEMLFYSMAEVIVKPQMHLLPFI